jgi:hypothetical protein
METGASTNLNLKNVNWNSDVISKKIKETNFSVFKKLDPDVKNVGSISGYVPVYRFIIEKKVWEKEEEGPLFIVQRAAKPEWQMFVLNRLTPRNFIQAITPDLEFEVSEPYLHFKSAQGEIFGFWMSNPKEREKLQTAIKK